MGNNWMVPLLVIGGIAVAGFLYLRSIGRLPELPCVSWLGCHGDPIPNQKGIAVGEYNPAIPKGKASSGCVPLKSDPTVCSKGLTLYNIRTGQVVGHGDPPPVKLGNPPSGPCPKGQYRTQGGWCLPL